MKAGPGENTAPLPFKRCLSSVLRGFLCIDTRQESSLTSVDQPGGGDEKVGCCSVLGGKGVSLSPDPVFQLSLSLSFEVASALYSSSHRKPRFSLFKSEGETFHCERRISGGRVSARALSLAGDASAGQAQRQALCGRKGKARKGHRAEDVRRQGPRGALG